MSTSDDDGIKRRYREFLNLLPMTTEIAGLPANTGPRSFTTDQMEARAQVLASAFKVARRTVREIVKGQ